MPVPASSAGPPPAPRRSQAERREATRTALLDATITCLVDHGYVQTTTARVADVAGVSRGAQAHYFASKAELVAAAVGHLAHRRIAEYGARIAAVPEGPDRAGAYLDLVWEAHAGDVFAATLELWVAARTDPALRGALVELERGVAAATWEQTVAVFGDAAARPGFREDLEFVLATVRGLALLRIAAGEDGRAVTAGWAGARARLERLLDDI